MSSRERASSRLADVYERLMSAKLLVRTGWMQRGVPPAIGETVSQHCFEAAIIALIISSRLAEGGFDVDPWRTAVAALLHDAGETLMGDPPRWTSLRLGDAKNKLEEEALKTLLEPLGLYRVFKELTPEEAAIVKLADYLSTTLQAARYLKAGYRGVDEILSTSLEAAKSLAENMGIPGIIEGILREILGEDL